MDLLRQTVAEIRDKAAEFRDDFGDEARARALEWAAARLDAALDDFSNQQLTLTQAARESGYSPEHLGRWIRLGKIPNAGRPNAPRIRRGDVPHKPGALRPKPLTLMVDRHADRAFCRELDNEASRWLTRRRNPGRTRPGNGE